MILLPGISAASESTSGTDIMHTINSIPNGTNWQHIAESDGIGGLEVLPEPNANACEPPYHIGKGVVPGLYDI